MSTYTAIHDTLTGRFLGVRRDDGAQVPPASGNADWQEFLAWNATADPPVSLDDVPGLTPEQVLAQKRAVAIGTLFSRADETAIAVRCVFQATQWLNNNRLEAIVNKIDEIRVALAGIGITIGAIELPPRVTQEEIIAVIAGDPTIGDPM